MFENIGPQDLGVMILVVFAFLALVVFGIGVWRSQPAGHPQVQTPQPRPQQPIQQRQAPQPQQRPQAQPAPAAPAPRSATPPASSGEMNQKAPTAAVTDKAKKEKAERRRLRDIPWWEIREIGALYGIKISGKVGTTWDRALLFVLGNLVLWGVCGMFIAFLMAIVGFGDNFDFTIITTALWALVVGSTYKLWLVSVPKLTGLITTNLLNNGEMHTYGPGIGVKYPWERYTPDDYIDIQTDLVAKTSRFVSEEGIGVKFTWSMQFTPFLGMLPLYIRTASKAIEEGLSEVVEAAFSISILGLHIDKMTAPATVDRIRENLLRMLEGRSVVDASGNEVEDIDITDDEDFPMEERFGIDVELGTLSPPDFDQDYKELVMGRVKAKGMGDDALELSKKTGVSSERALRTIMIMNKEEGVDDRSFTIDLTDNAKAAAGDAAEVLKAGVTVAKAAGHKAGGK